MFIMNTLNLIANTGTLQDPDLYTEITVDAGKIIESWTLSVMSLEWLDKKGRIKALKNLKPMKQEKRLAIEEALKNGERIEKPILGIGLYDNVEMGSGRAAFVTLAAQGFDCIPVHVRKSQLASFQEFVCDVG